MTDLAWLLLFQLALTKATPLLLAATGGLLSERSGIINIGLEGMMLAGAFGSMVGAHYAGSPWIGALSGAASGACLGGIHAVWSIRFRSDQIISGTAVNLLAVGGTGYLLPVLFGGRGSSPGVDKLPMLGFGSIAFHPTVYLSLLLVLIVGYVVFRTRWGLRLRAAGERPETLIAAGLSVEQIRYFAVVLSGALAGLAGAHLALADLSQFVERMTAGRGFIALAALIVGKWRPAGVLYACLAFGLAEAIADSFQGYGTGIPSQVFLVLPFVLTMMALAGFIGRSNPPAALGQSLQRDG